MKAGDEEVGRSGASAIGHRVDRSVLLDLEAAFGEENLVAVAITKLHRWVIHANDDMNLPHLLAVSSPEGWVELEKVEIWSVALIPLGALIDEFIEEVPTDELLSPSPTVMIAYNEPTDKALAALRAATTPLSPGMMQLLPPQGPAGIVVGGGVGDATGAEVGGGEVAGLEGEPLPAEPPPTRPLPVGIVVVTEVEVVVVAAAAARSLVGAALRGVAA